MKSNLKESDSVTCFYQHFITLDAELSLSKEEDFTANIYYEKDLVCEQNITVYKGDYIHEYFVYEDGRFLSTRSDNNSLTEFAAGKYRLTQNDGTVWIFSDPFSCKVTGIYAAKGRQLFFTYNKRKQLISIRNLHGFNISLIWNYGHLSEITETIYPLQM